MLKRILKQVFCKWNRISHPANLSILPDKPYSCKLGWERGTPIDRIYMEQFLEQHKKYIHGTIMEIAENTYSIKYGHNLERSLIFTADNMVHTSENIIIGDLQSGEGTQENLLDCFILTQTLPFIYDIHSCCENIIKMLKSGGTALITVRGISAISTYDEVRWGDYWGFTAQSLKKLFSGDNIEIISLEQYGNLKTAVGFLYGLAYEDLEDRDFKINDKLYPVLLGIVIRKK